MIEVDSFKTLRKLPSKIEEGEVAYIRKTDTMYKYHNNAWEIVKPSGEMNFPLYKLNASMIKQLPSHTEEELKKDFDLINEFIKKTNNKYYTLMCKNMGGTTFYCTLFTVTTETPEITESLFFTEMQMGMIHAIQVEETHIEIWCEVKDAVECYVFLPYDLGVIEI